MTEQERVDKLKARMSRWQAYVDRPQANTLPQTADAAETQVEVHQGRTVHKADRPQPRFLPEPAGGTTPGRGDVRAEAPPPDPLMDIQEARIADLKRAVAREREQADRMADEVRRAQHLHAATLYSHLADEKVRHAVHLPAQRQILEAPSMDYEEARRKNLVRLIGLSLAITSVLIIAFFLTR